MATPNLLRLKLIDNFYPNLASCEKTLKCLEYDGWPRKLVLNDFDQLLNPSLTSFHAGINDDETFDLDQFGRTLA